MEHVRARPRIAVALEAMNTCLKLCEIDVIPSTRSCVRGPERTSILSCFPCKQSTQLSPSWQPRVARNRIALLSNSLEKVIPALSKGIKHINNGFGRDSTRFSHPLEEIGIAH